MNLPMGNAIFKGKTLKENSFLSAIEELHKKAISGYLVLTSHSPSGMEEGVLLYRNGEITGSVFSFLKFNETLFSNDAARLLMNAAQSEYGVFDAITLSKQQAELVLAFNDKMAFEKLLSPKDLSKLAPKKYESSLVERYVGEKLKLEESRIDVLKRFGLKGVQ
jgi:hypothetical protein